MPIDMYSVVIFTGHPNPEAVKAVGPFKSRDDADAWIQSEGCGERPGTDEWAVVIPADTP